MEERLDSVVDHPTTGRQHSWLDKYHARILATLKDRAWRSAELLELCRMTFTRLNEVLFPSGPQPQGMRALLDIFRHTGPIRDLLTRKLVVGAKRGNGVCAESQAIFGATSTRNWGKIRASKSRWHHSVCRVTD